MKVLVAKRTTPPRQTDDVWSAMQGEIVVAPFVCQDSDCDCDRVHQGIVSHGYSTEAEVRDIDASDTGGVSPSVGERRRTVFVARRNLRGVHAGRDNSA
jgi:hypothetical protein